jgi:hypothetical protein
MVENCPPEMYCAECPYYQAEGLCLHALVKEHKEQEDYHRRLRQKYEAAIRDINIRSYAVKQEAQP